ncbi:MAG: hypothetical protein IAI48_06045 [Candidatus Eremiobacteraeota bacterium]|nr:hypothetical protein [Candidatus Eremiobacteraeota bacterium]
MTIVSVAFDTGGPDAVRAFIRPAVPIVVPAPMREIMSWTAERYDNAATPTYPCLIDEKHVVAELYDMPNVPMAVWIDENGRIVRPAESAGATDGFRKMDRTTFTMPKDVADNGRAVRARYVAALRDWIERGAGSRYVLTPEEIRERSAGPTETDALGAASFRLGQYLHGRGETALAKRWFDDARRLCPDRWTFFRQALHLEETGKASGPEFQAAVKALGDSPYYPPADLEPSGH